jgi:hypothetical protein
LAFLLAKKPNRENSFCLALSCALSHAVLDVVIDDEVEFFIGETVVPSKDKVDLVNDGFAEFRKNKLDGQGVVLEVHLSVFRAGSDVFHHFWRKLG